MATKEEILQDIKNRKNELTSVSVFYRFKEGEKFILQRPQPETDIDMEIAKILANGEADEDNFNLTSLLYYRTLKDSAPADRIFGVVSLDNNLYNEDEPQKAKTEASAAFLPEEEMICVRGDIFSGSPKNIAFDITCTLHESRHYHQILSRTPYTKTLDGKVDGEPSEKELIATAFRMFEMKDLFPGASREDCEKLSYAMYHQQDIEIDAREYSLSESIKIVQNALNNPDFSHEQKERLFQILEELNNENLENANKTAEQENIYNMIANRVKELSLSVQKRAREVLSDENIAKLHIMMKETQKPRILDSICFSWRLHCL